MWGRCSPPKMAVLALVRVTKYTFCRGRVGSGLPSLSAAARAWIIIASCVALIGCGTNVRELLEDDSRISWQAYSAIEQAEALDIGLEGPIYNAEAAKEEACEPIYAAAAERFPSDTVSFWEELWSDLVQFVVRVVPIDTVETCAKAHKRYKDETLVLRDRLQHMNTR